MKYKLKLLPTIKPKRFTFKFRGEECLNCEHTLDVSDRFCPNCGQANTTKKISVWDLIQELFSSVFSYDSKLWKSMKLLFTKPGGLSLAYVNGKRSTYINPFRFFLSISILFFLVISFFINDEDYKGFDFVGDQTEILNELEENEIQVDSLQVDSIEKLVSKDEKIAKKEKYLKESFDKETFPSFEQAVKESELEDTILDWAFYKVYKNLAKMQVNTAGFIRYMVPKVPFFIFFFIPLFTLVNALLFLRSNKTYVDHLVYNYNLSSFLLIMLAALIFVENYFSITMFGFLFWVGIYFYTYKSIRLFYANKRFKSILKSLFIAFFYPTFLSIFLGFLVVISFIFY